MSGCLLTDKVYDISVFTNNFSTRGSTVIVELSKYFSQLCREMYPKDYPFLSRRRQFLVY